MATQRRAGLGRGVHCLALPDDHSQYELGERETRDHPSPHREGEG
ncbi:MAG: hypothetical protein ACLQT7_08655 [Candidatus Dormibacteria bacterium]